MLRLHRPDSGARVRLELAALRAPGRPRPAGAAAAAHGRRRDGGRITRARRRRCCRTSNGVSLDRCVPAPVFARNVGVLLARTDNALAQLPGRPRRHRARHHRSRLGARSARDLPQARRLSLAARRGRAGRRRARRRGLAGAAAAGDPRRRLAQQHHLRRPPLRADRLRRRRRRARASPTRRSRSRSSRSSGGRLRPEIWSGLWAGYAAIVNPSDDERAAVLPLVKLRYATLIVDHVWRELSGRHHPGHLALVALGHRGAARARLGAVDGAVARRRPDAGRGVSVTRT